MHEINGKVIKGKQRGKKLGFPTANIKTHDNIPQGIYISTTNIKDKIYNSITFVGNAVTFGEEEIFVETYILDFNEDIYDKEINVNLLERIRDNEKFDTVEKLIEQIEKDIALAKEYFNKNV